MATHALRYCASPRLALFLFVLPHLLFSQQPSELFHNNCAGCHGEDARGSAKAPGLAMNQRVAGQSPEQLSAFLAQGNIAGGMPSFADLSARLLPSVVSILTHLIGLRKKKTAKPAPKARVETEGPKAKTNPVVRVAGYAWQLYKFYRRVRPHFM